MRFGVIVTITITQFPSSHENDITYTPGIVPVPPVCFMPASDNAVTAHRHLPDVPSAAEVEENGVDAGEMNKLLLQKVEELTLYVIDLQKQIDELKSNKQYIQK